MNALPGTPLDAAEIKPCAFCGKGMMHGGEITFYQVDLAQCVVDIAAVQRLHGLEMMMMGNVGIARALSPDTAIARRLPATRHLVCQPCLLRKDGLAQLFAIADEKPESAS